MGEAEVMQMAMARFATFVAVALVLVKYIGLAGRAWFHPRGGPRTVWRFLLRNGEVVFLFGILAYYWRLMFVDASFTWPRYMPTGDGVTFVNLFLALYFFVHAWPGRRRRFEDWLENDVD